MIWLLPLLELLLAVHGMHTKYHFVLSYNTCIALMCLCLLLMFIVYLLIYRQVKKQQRQVSRLKREEEKRMVCWIITETISMSFEVDLTLRYVTSNITCFNCICDPFIYSLRLSKVRQIWRRSFQSCFTDGSIHSEVTQAI